MSELESKSREHTQAIAESFRAGDGWLREADDSVNDSARGLIAATVEDSSHGAVWLGRMNWGTTPKTAIWQHNGRESVCNFEADFVLPGDAPLAVVQRLDALIIYRLRCEYAGTKADGWHIDQIHKAIAAGGGQLLMWA